MSRIRALICALLLGVILGGLVLIYAATQIPAPPPVKFKAPAKPVIQKEQDCPTWPRNFYCDVRTI